MNDLTTGFTENIVPETADVPPEHLEKQPKRNPKPISVWKS